MKTVVSADRTLIAYEQGGKGPHLLLVHGTTANRSRFASIRPRFERYFTVAAMDRRGRGDSGDGLQYSLEREFEDVVAVVKALSTPVLLFGHSFGALCGLGAAMLTDELSGLILYEPWISQGDNLYSSEQLERMDALIALGDREGTVIMMFGEIGGMPPQEIELLKVLPSWPDRIAAAHTIPRESRAEDSYRLPTDRMAKLSIPVLLLLGGDSPPAFRKIMTMLEKTLPNARTVTMPGQRHIAMDTGPDLLVNAVLDFWREVG